MNNETRCQPEDNVVVVCDRALITVDILLALLKEFKELNMHDACQVIEVKLKSIRTALDFK